jgi:hypothetical protein
MYIIDQLVCVLNRECEANSDDNLDEDFKLPTWVQKWSFYTHKWMENLGEAVNQTFFFEFFVAQHFGRPKNLSRFMTSAFVESTFTLVTLVHMW